MAPYGILANRTKFLQANEGAEVRVDEVEGLREVVGTLALCGLELEG